jgi:hypothetical protein
MNGKMIVVQKQYYAAPVTESSRVHWQSLCRGGVLMPISQKLAFFLQNMTSGIV